MAEELSDAVEDFTAAGRGQNSGGQSSQGVQPQTAGVDAAVADVAVDIDTDVPDDVVAVVPVDVNVDLDIPVDATPVNISV